jgi:hypothetical protein
VAVKTPLRSSESSADLLREPLAPIGHLRPPSVQRGRMVWSIVMLFVLVAALAIGIVLQIRSNVPTWEGDWKDLIVEAPGAEAPAPTAYTGDWKDLIVEAPAASASTGDWKDLIVEAPAASASTGDWKDLIEAPAPASSGDWKDLIG